MSTFIRNSPGRAISKTPAAARRGEKAFSAISFPKDRRSKQINIYWSYIKQKDCNGNPAIFDGGEVAYACNRIQKT